MPEKKYLVCQLRKASEVKMSDGPLKRYLEVNVRHSMPSYFTYSPGTPKYFWRKKRDLASRFWGPIEATEWALLVDGYVEEEHG